jgi:hypothetical protein
MRLNVMAGLTVIILLVWAASWVVGLPHTQLIAALLAIPYAGITVYLAWAQVRAR